MNSAQRRKQRRFMLANFNAGVNAGHEDIRRSLAMVPRGGWTTVEIIKHEVDGLAKRWNAAEGRLSLAKEELREAQAKLTAADHEIRKLAENAKRAGPVIAEFHIAFRHVAEAITGVPPQFRDDVADINKLRLRLLAALKGRQSLNFNKHSVYLAAHPLHVYGSGTTWPIGTFVVAREEESVDRWYVCADLESGTSFRVDPAKLVSAGSMPEARWFAWHAYRLQGWAPESEPPTEPADDAVAATHIREFAAMKGPQ